MAPGNRPANSAFSIGVCGAFSSGFPDSPGREAPLPWDIEFVNGLVNLSHIGVYGMANIGVLAATPSPFNGGYGLVACNTGSGYSAAFSGAVKIEGVFEITGQVKPFGQDCAECFDLAHACEAEPGSVMALDADGKLVISHEEYDRKVAGVVSGAGDYQPGIVLGGHQASDSGQAQIALVGRAMCKVDASFAPIEVGDLLTTSSKPGHAMKATDPDRAFGAVIGKALRPLREGRSLIPILVALQ